MQSTINILATPEQAKEMLGEISNGTLITQFSEDGNSLVGFALDGEFCTEDLEAALVYLLSLVPKEGSLIDPDLLDITNIEHPRDDEFDVVSARYGISSRQGFSYRTRGYLSHETPTANFTLSGMSASKGGRVWISEVTKTAEIQCLLAELESYCRVRGTTMSKVEDYI